MYLHGNISRDRTMAILGNLELYEKALYRMQISLEVEDKHLTKIRSILINSRYNQFYVQRAINNAMYTVNMTQSSLNRLIQQLNERKKQISYARTSYIENQYLISRQFSIYD